MKSKQPVIPAVLSSSPEVFAQRLEFARTAANAVHFDVLDGQFCPGKALPIEHWPAVEIGYSEAHLMVEKPADYLEALAGRQITRALIHIESEYTLTALRQQARQLDILLGFVVSPDTDLALLQPALAVSTYVQVMGVHPGSSGQRLLDTTLTAVRYLRTQPSQKLVITVDGGVTLPNAPSVFQAGANYIITTQALFQGAKWSDNYQALLQAASVRAAPKPKNSR